MASPTIGRLGYMGLGIEDTPGTAVDPDVYLPYSDAPTLRGHHEPIPVLAAKTARHADKDSVVGQKWGEGDVQIDLDVVNSGYLWKLALGNELLSAGTPNNHTFYTTVSGNTPNTATLRYGRETDNMEFTYGAVDELSMEVPNDGLATLSASFLSKFPTACAEQSPTTTSGTVLTWKDMSVKFGSDLSAASGASATAVNELSLTYSNGLEAIHRSGDSDVSIIRSTIARLTGSYTIFFENTTNRDAYHSLNKRAMEITFTGNANEQLRIRIPQFRLDDGEISTGLDDFFIIQGSFTAEDVVDSGVRLFDVRLQNDKGTVYGA